MQSTLFNWRRYWEHVTDFLLNICAFACRSARLFLFGRSASAFERRLGRGHALALFGYRCQDAFGSFLDDMAGAELMREIAKDLADRVGREG